MANFTKENFQEFINNSIPVTVGENKIVVMQFEHFKNLTCAELRYNDVTLANIDYMVHNKTEKEVQYYVAGESYHYMAYLSKSQIMNVKFDCDYLIKEFLRQEYSKVGKMAHFISDYTDRID